MGIGVMGIGQAKRKLQRSLTPRNGSMTSCHSVPKGHVAIYVGETQVKRFVIPISYLNHPLFANLLHLVEEEFGFDHPGNLMIPCSEDYFLNLISCLNRL